ncbi:MAG: His/Gly/Thr/Pro-type tRNA ligase C-terminal domain-containing protein, partial [Candidatus Omnitrophota bacterium]
QLGTKYSQAQQALYSAEDGQRRPVIMGCYGIGVSRLIAAIIEKNNDATGIVWPREVAPFDVEILPVQVNEPEVMQLAKEYYSDLQKLKWDVLLDDRDESAGRKFSDADLIGIPLRVTIGKRNLTQGQVEIKDRRTQQVILVNKNDVQDCLSKMVAG